MNLFAPGRTPFDLYFKLFGTYVRVHPLFWGVIIIFNWNLVNRVGGFQLLGLWALSCFVSILLHEFGHIWAGQIFGSHGEVLLYGFGGLALGASDLRARWKRIVVYLAGPAIQLLLYLVIWKSMSTFSQEQREALPFYVERFVDYMVWINLYWALFNLLPINPLDGGQVAREICTAIWGTKGTRFALGLSLIACGILVLNAFVAMSGKTPFLPWFFPASQFAVLMFALLGMANYQMLQIEKSRDPWERSDDY